MVDENVWYTKEMRRLELQKQNLDDRHSVWDERSDPNDMEHLINSSIHYTPRKNQTWESYVKELQTHIKYANDKNTKTHIEGKRQWYTHRSPLGCFMCEDIEFRSVMFRVLKHMAKQYPDNLF